jgi:hypothetical protein
LFWRFICLGIWNLAYVHKIWGLPPHTPCLILGGCRPPTPGCHPPPHRICGVCGGGSPRPGDLGAAAPQTFCTCARYQVPRSGPADWSAGVNNLDPPIGTPQTSLVTHGMCPTAGVGVRPRAHEEGFGKGRATWVLVSGGGYLKEPPVIKAASQFRLKVHEIIITPTLHPLQL